MFVKDRSMLCPEPGIYYDASFQDYLSWDAISNSRLNLANRSLAHFKKQIPLEPTPALRLGQLVHCGRLEPLAIAQRYAVLPRFENDPENLTKKGERPASPKSTGYYTEKVEWFTEANRGKEIVSEDQYKRMVGVVESLSCDERASELFREHGPVEVSIVWIDEDTGLKCKARIDKASDDWRNVTDLKTSRDASQFSKAIANYGYHRQMAHYSRGVHALTGVQPTTYLVAVESDCPYGVRSAPLSLEAIDIGESEVRSLLRDIANAMETNRWPCYESPDKWVLPSWYGDSGDPIEITVSGETVSI